METSKFGKLTIITRKGQLALCKCDCGKIKKVYMSNLRSGSVRSCGCLKQKDLTDKRFGYLTAKHRLEGKKIYWRCLCDCGNETDVYSSHLTGGRIKSCGCMQYILGSKARRVDELPSGFNTVFKDYRIKAKQRNLEWSLTRDEVYELLTGNCYYCGGNPSNVCNKGKMGEFTYNGIDRIDNTTGYHKDNTVSCCWIDNLAKGKLSHDEYIRHVRCVARNFEGKNG